MLRITQFGLQSSNVALTCLLNAFIFWLGLIPMKEIPMVVAKLNCTQMLVKGGDGRVFMVDRRTPGRMELVMEASPPKEGETTKIIIPFQPKRLFKPEWYSHAKGA